MSVVTIMSESEMLLREILQTLKRIESSLEPVKFSDVDRDRLPEQACVDDRGVVQTIPPSHEIKFYDLGSGKQRVYKGRKFE